MSGFRVAALDTYQERAGATAKYDRYDLGVPRIAYLGLKLAGESGEVAEKLGKYYRDSTEYDALKDDLKKELGDVLWYVSELARQLGFSLSDIAQTNLDKLADRRNRGVIGGSGDDR